MKKGKKTEKNKFCEIAFNLQFDESIEFRSNFMVPAIKSLIIQDKPLIIYRVKLMIKFDWFRWQRQMTKTHPKIAQ